MDRFRDRNDAGRQLAAELETFADERPIVLALPRGGVPVGYEVARALGAPLDVWVVRKIGVPWQPELGVGAVAEGGYIYLSQEMLRMLGLSEEELSQAIETKRREVEARVRKYRAERPAPDLFDRTVILVDDGIATGGTVRAAVRSARTSKPRRVVLAVPVAARQSVDALSNEVDEIVALNTPSGLLAIGSWYDDFRQVPDAEVVDILERAHNEHAQPPPSRGRSRHRPPGRRTP